MGALKHGAPAPVFNPLAKPSSLDNASAVSFGSAIRVTNKLKLGFVAVVVIKVYLAIKSAPADGIGLLLRALGQPDQIDFVLAAHAAGSDYEIGRASCREECRSRWSPYH